MPHREETYAEETAAAIDQEVRGIVQSAMDRALAILRDKRDVLERSARKLLEKETLDENDLSALIGPPAGPPIRVGSGVTIRTSPVSSRFSSFASSGRSLRAPVIRSAYTLAQPTLILVRQGPSADGKANLF